MNPLEQLFDTSDFPARWNCGRWTASHGWLHILSDLGIWSAYLAIPMVLAFFLLRRRDLPFRKVFLLFVLFILACGTTHLIEAIIFWWPAYRLAGVVKLFTAVISWTTVIALIPILPRALSMRSVEDCEREIAERTSQLQEALRALHLEHERFAITLGSIGDAVIATDTAGIITFQNEVSRSLTGWNDEAFGQPLDDVFKIVNEQTGAEVESPVAKVLREGTIVGLANHTILLGKDGRRTPIEDSGAPIRSGDRIVGVVLVYRDATERRRQDEQLREQRERLNFALIASELGHWELNLIDHTAIRTLRHDQIFGYDELLPEWTHERFLSHVLEEDRPDVQARVAASQAEGTSLQLECRIRRTDGAIRWIWSQARMIRDTAGTPTRMIGLVGDITERKEAVEALKLSDRHKDDFLAVLAHELRNPLAPIRNGVQFLKWAKTDEEREQARAMMERQLTQLVHLVDDLIDVSRISRGKIALRKERVELTELLHQAVEASQPTITAACHRFDFQSRVAPIIVDADPTRIVQIFANLLTNSAKYTPAGGAITLTATVMDGQVIVAVKDNGVGIPAEMLPKVFDAFTQVNRSLEKSQGGLGIGLTIVRNLVHLHGGTIEARSDGPDRGSEFTVVLPLVANIESLTPEPSIDPASPSAIACLRMLVVDDNEDSALTLAMLLTALGHDVQTCHDGERAVQMAGEMKPDLILMDVGMPRMNGYDATRAIRNQPSQHRPHIIALTGWGQQEDRQQSKAAGCDDHLVKPVDADALQRVLQTVSESKSSSPTV
ncbi:hypothetical protein BH11PLA2_BH11PLA2_44990 [soil metagenome]